MNGDDFILAQRKAQSAFFRAHVPAEAVDGYQLAPDRRDLNLAPHIRKIATEYFKLNDIAWHRYANHGLSSQVCCLNFLMPLATQPELLERIIGTALGLDGIEVEEMEKGPDKQPWFVAFEWTGCGNYFGEWAAGAKPTRGANVTSADAAVRFRQGGKTHVVLIEWKYTEKYGAPLDPKSAPTQTNRYKDKYLNPKGPMRSDLELTLDEFFWEPLYQLLRQQMLAWHMQRDPAVKVDRVSVLHISPSGNEPLHRVTSPALRRFGDDVFAVFRGLLVEPETLVSRTTEQVFGSFVSADYADPAGQEWAAYLRDRYTFLFAS